jgi:predicted Ser/Thr protein kinase
MGKRKDAENNHKDGLDIDLKECRLIGVGNNGWVYRMPDGRVIKICREAKSCIKEYAILKRTNGNKHFPRVYGQCGNYMIRDYVGGECMKDYIKRKGLSRRLAVNLIELIEEFRRLEFTKLDIRCRDLYVQKNEHIMVIDPRASYTRNVGYPRHLMKGLNNLRVLDKFMEIVKKERPDIYKRWTELINSQPCSTDE